MTEWTAQSARFWKDLTVEPETQRNMARYTFCEVEELIQEMVNEYRVLITTAHQCGVDREHIRKIAAKVNIKNDKRGILAFSYFAAAERGSRIGKAAADSLFAVSRT